MFHRQPRTSSSSDPTTPHGSPELGTNRNLYGTYPTSQPISAAAGAGGRSSVTSPPPPSQQVSRAMFSPNGSAAGHDNHQPPPMNGMQRFPSSSETGHDADSTTGGKRKSFLGIKFGKEVSDSRRKRRDVLDRQEIASADPLLCPETRQDTKRTISKCSSLPFWTSSKQPPSNAILSISPTIPKEFRWQRNELPSHSR